MGRNLTCPAVAVLGGTGCLGSAIADELVQHGHEVSALSRRPRNKPSPVDHVGVDLSSGAGLPDALSGVEVVVDASNATRPRAVRKVLVEGTRRLLEAEERMGVRHHVLVSIVGIEHVPFGYYWAKLAQERLVAEGPVSATVLRATQAHQLVHRTFSITSRVGFLPRGEFALQPIDPREVARTLGAALEAGPLQTRLEVAGPQVLGLTELARLWLAAMGMRRVLVPVPIVGRAARALRAGALTALASASGALTFDDWLTASRLDRQ